MGKSKISFGSEPLMREVPPGTTAIIQIGKLKEVLNLDEWTYGPTEWGDKYSIPVVILSHPSYESFPVETTWQSKSGAAELLYYYFFTVEGEPKTFDWDVNKEFEGKWNLIRFEDGRYKLEQ